MNSSHHDNGVGLDGEKECLPRVDTSRLIHELREAFLAAFHATSIIGYAFPSHCNTAIKVGDGTAPYCIGYNVMTDPSNLLVNLPTGTVFGLWKNPCYKSESKELNVEDMKGHEMIGAGYVLYGTKTVILMAFEHEKGVYEYYFDKGLGCIVMKTRQRSKLRKRGYFYCANEGYTIGWDEPTRKMISKMKDPRNTRPRTSYNMGSLVPNFHRVFQQGGFYLYPANKLEPNGGMLLLQECWPLAYIAAESGGYASNGQRGILSLVPSSCWEKTPFYTGSITDCLDLMEMHFAYVANQLVKPPPDGLIRRACPLCLEETRILQKEKKNVICSTCKTVLNRRERM